MPAETRTIGPGAVTGPVGMAEQIGQFLPTSLWKLGDIGVAGVAIHICKQLPPELCLAISPAMHA